MFRDRAAVLIAPAILVVVALVQIVRARTLDQSSWAGVGFGMFATIDNHGSRFVRGTVDPGAESARSAAPPASLDDEAVAVRVVPNESRARALAEAWLSVAPAESRAVHVELWGVALDPHGPSLSAHRLVAADATREAP